MGGRAPSWREMHDAHQVAADIEDAAQKGRGKAVKYRGSKEEKAHRSWGGKKK